MLEIEKGVPLPKKFQAKKISMLDQIPWQQMEIGDSVYLKHTGCCGVHKRAKGHGLLVAIKADGWPAHTGFRIWVIGKVGPSEPRRT
ncbi:MAG TPA: hypothetical protein VJ801_02320 [Polyangia bacterium]|jgi:hypothetical protein|nr:hypothetical protein [Polyangia bacterium]